MKQKNVQAKETFRAFFQDGHFGAFRCSNEQRFDFESVMGQVQSACYAPKTSHSHYAPLQAGLRTLFPNYARAGNVTFAYRTDVYYGEPSAN